MKALIGADVHLRSSNGGSSPRRATIVSLASSQRWQPGLRVQRHASSCDGVPGQVFGVGSGLQKARRRGDHRRVVRAELAGDELQVVGPAPRRGPPSAPGAASSRRHPRPAPRPSTRHRRRRARAWLSAGRPPPPDSWRQGRRAAAPSRSAVELADLVQERRLQPAEAEVEARVSGHPHREGERLRDRLRRRRARSPARPGTPSPAAWRPCRAPRRPRRQASARAPRSRLALRTPASRVWPPLAIRHRNGGSSGSGSRKLAATCPCRWFTPARGFRVAAASDFAVATPTRSAPIRPGPRVTASDSSPRELHLGLGQRRIDHRVDELEVMPRCDLRHHPAIARVSGSLRGDHVGADVTPIGDRGAGVVAGGLDREDQASTAAVTSSHMIKASSPLSW